MFNVVQRLQLNIQFLFFFALAILLARDDDPDIECNLFFS